MEEYNFALWSSVLILHCSYMIAFAVHLLGSGPFTMKSNVRFLGAIGGVSLVVGYLIWTGVTETMTYYLTPIELINRVEEDPTFHQVGVKVSGRLEKDSWSRDSDELLHYFTVADLEDESVRFSVEYRDILPDTFNDQELQDVVLEGRFREDGVFDATVVLTKCGSRYEATPEELVEGYIE